ncbi:CBS domain-containing protein (plasmid) [Paraclostridium bifermentans]|uniref:CBS domain-containing protein n=1 Tax=Paraclostridium bifermentans TaxID=1490 RepID=A0ABY8R8G6_PARBF|nr:CBS domain-containing protein [Paraclostridium bifermentans]
MLSIPEIKTVEEVMDTTYVTITEDMTIKEVIKSAKKDDKKTFIVTHKDNQLKGIMSFSDIHGLCKDDIVNKKLKINNIMNTDMISVSKNTNINDCIDLMIKNNIGVFPIIEKDKIIGVLTQKHIREYLHMNFESYNNKLKRIIGSLREGICALNEDGVVILWNEFMEKDIV